SYCLWRGLSHGGGPMKRLGLNRLWVQFSLAFSGVVMLAAMMMVMIGFLLRPMPDGERPIPTAQQQQALRVRLAEGIARSLVSVAVTGSLVGIAAGIWMSRRMTAPLVAL